MSKTKSVQLIKACYDAGQRHFGENYVSVAVLMRVASKLTDVFYSGARTDGESAASK